MKHLANLPRHFRWAVPTGIIAAVAGVLAASTISAAAAVPPLPPRTAAQLLAAVEANGSVPPLTGTVVESASLGLPALPSEPGTSALPSLLAGSNRMHVWYSDPAHYKIAIPRSMSESDVVRNGGTLWFWDSSSDQVTQLALPAGARAPSVQSIPLTPQQAAEQALAQAGASTIVRVDSNVTVAGQAAYQLVLVPKSSSSLIGEVRIAIDSAHNVPLRVQVFAKHAASPAIQVAYTAVSFGQPAASNFAFSPPAGATIVHEKTGSGGKGTGTAPGHDVADGSRVIGSGWLAVLSMPESSVSALTGSPSGSALGPLTSSHQAAAPSGSGATAPGLDMGSIFGALLKSAEQVSGPWGSGRLLRTGLLSVLFTSDNRVLIGAVTPDVLYRALGQHGQAPAAGSQHGAVRSTSR